MKNKWVLIPLILIALSLIFPAAIAQEEGLHGSGGIIEIILDVLVLISIVAAVFLGMGTFGGAIGTGLKPVFIGLLIFGINYLLEASHHVGGDRFLLALLGETGHELIHHLLALVAFTLVAYGFYKIGKITKA